MSGGHVRLGRWPTSGAGLRRAGAWAAGALAAAAGAASLGAPGLLFGVVGPLLAYLPARWRAFAVFPLALLALPPLDHQGAWVPAVLLAASAACAALDIAGAGREVVLGILVLAALAPALVLAIPRLQAFLAADPALAPFLVGGAALVSLGAAVVSAPVLDAEEPR